MPGQGTSNDVYIIDLSRMVSASVRNWLLLALGFKNGLPIKWGISSQPQKRCCVVKYRGGSRGGSTSVIQAPLFYSSYTNTYNSSVSELPEPPKSRSKTMHIGGSRGILYCSKNSEEPPFFR